MSALTTLGRFYHTGHTGLLQWTCTPGSIADILRRLDHTVTGLPMSTCTFTAESHWSLSTPSDFASGEPYTLSDGTHLHWNRRCRCLYLDEDTPTHIRNAFALHQAAASSRIRRKLDSACEAG